jgi:serine/threonine protein kinase
MDCPDLTPNGLKPIMMLGKGAHGDVYLSEDTYGNLHATKVIRSGYLRSPLELYIQKAIGNQYIMGIRDVSFGENVVINMEVASDGMGLIKKLDLTYEEKVSIVYKLLSGVYCLHNNGIIHRDIKNANILMTLNTKGNSRIVNPILIDFGLSIVVKSSKVGYITNSNVGTIAFIPLEVLESEKKVYNQKSDMWSLGLVIYYIFTGSHFIQAKSNEDEVSNVVIKYLSSLLKDESYDAVLKERLHGFAGKSFPSINNDMIYDFISRLIMLDESKRYTAWEAINHPMFGAIYDDPNRYCDIPTIQWPPEDYQTLDFDGITYLVKEIAIFMTSNTMLRKEHIGTYYLALDLAYRYLALPNVRDNMGKFSQPLFISSIVILALRTYGYDVSVSTLRKSIPIDIPRDISEKSINDIILSFDSIIYRRFIYDSYRTRSELKEMDSNVLNSRRYYEFIANPVDPLKYDKDDNLSILQVFGM